MKKTILKYLNSIWIFNTPLFHLENLNKQENFETS